jgi:hypothetical protein
MNDNKPTQSQVLLVRAILGVAGGASLWFGQLITNHSHEFMLSLFGWGWILMGGYLLFSALFKSDDGVGELALKFFLTKSRRSNKGWCPRTTRMALTTCSRSATVAP